MTAIYNHWTLVFMAACGICLIAIGVMFVTTDTLLEATKSQIYEHRALVEGRPGYKLFMRPVTLIAKFYLFHVNNPDAVMQGAAPIFTEKGPYVYTEIIEREILSVDEETDEILYMTRHLFTFNKRESGNATENDEITILNPAYMGTINMLASLTADIMQQFGNNIAKLFPSTSVVFVKGKAGSILFYGMKFTCNDKKFKELAIICSTLESSKPPIVIDGPRPGIYFYSFFQKLNNTLRGPFRVKRGLKDITEIANITEYKGKRIQKIWATDECNTVRGTDTIQWAPMPKILNEVHTFPPELCRSLTLYYQRNTIVNGMVGALYTLTSKTWEPSEIDCYCPVVNNEKQCLPKGILDIGKCQEIPVLLSEPHFLHGDPALLQYAQGLKPREMMHAHQSYIIIEPYTGTPLSGEKKTQLNLKLSRHPVDILKNVSEGYFPLVWHQEGSTADVSEIAPTYQILQLIHVVWFLQFVPLIIGAHILLMTLYLCGIRKRKSHVSDIVAESLVVSPASFISTITQGPLSRPRGLFE